MAIRTVPLVPMGEEPSIDAAMQQPPWRNTLRLSTLADRAERWLDSAGFDRAPWLAVALAGGIAVWFVLARPAGWIAALSGGLAVAALALLHWRGRDDRSHLRLAAVTIGLVFAIGVALIWTRSSIVGTPPLERPMTVMLDGRVLEREDQPAQARVRLTLAYREGDTGQARKVRVNVPADKLASEVAEGARVRLRARLMPPAAPMVPGAYDFARTAWFSGLSATGSAVGSVEIVEAPHRRDALARWQRSLAEHVRSQVAGSEGSIAAAFASGDRGGISERDEQAMRDSGLTHLLSISGLHVSAVIAGAYVLAMRLFALWPWLALRIRLPLAAAVCGAVAGVGYTLLTGAEVPTVRSCIGALLVLGALALGREPLSLRMVAAAAFVVMLFWPEAVASPGFQMSFAAVIAIVALHGAGPVRAFLAPREESWLERMARRLLMLLLTGVVIELTLMPIVLFHFHRAGFYGALANVVAIPLVTFVTMPLIAAALLFDLVGAGAPLWWLTGKSLSLLLDIAQFTASQPGAVKLMPQMSWIAFALFVGGGLWLALWQGRRRLFGLIPVAVASGLLITTPVPDILVASDGKHVGVTGEGERLIVLREGRSTFARDNLLELAGMQGEPLPIGEWSGARCSRDFCTMTIHRGGRDWTVLMARNRSRIEERALSAACQLSDIVIADRWLPRSCRPRWLKADRRYLTESGGLAIDLDDAHVRSVAEGQGALPWWTKRGT
ncbi:DUF4131 domain-containing protein [Altererythrobacter aerius]|uniref:DUF4131 domain-containing protein n=1 Tax=Tsuneonella aeria TaxID=1837929 RepID=A0A6I4TA54_9SPHN|nr:ComEC/Rec2 family competence protein [Tsuneonella aeria]MXO74102.1 DUF4131 domain-containing protein [Tsuneonella aeria]